MTVTSTNWKTDAADRLQPFIDHFNITNKIEYFDSFQGAVVVETRDDIRFSAVANNDDKTITIDLKFVKADIPIISIRALPGIATTAARKAINYVA
ncbi:hypothetical protein H0194_04670 [Corynebacterium incognita]|uniref:Uncharacterized protein n=1 Tax=Corynebacterium incognita TaxID=2754725 RepID=A0A7G7CRQ8_9CORY|nr:hypothetical protein [Corynebacterium incognita]QNE90274.1 hypothetical protein H0194_04670 [Corynebacterium incognita]